MKKRYLIILFLLITLLASVLRFYDISNNPPGLYIDEVSIGYNAHTILTKGVDEYGLKYPMAFKTFGDYKMPLYIYSTALSEFIFGKNEFSVRFPSALSGVITVILFYFFVKNLLQIRPLTFSTKMKKYLPLVAMFSLAISPWHIQFSRGGFEVNMALAFYLAALFFISHFLVKKKFIYLILSAVFFTATLYTYFVYRVITPFSIVIIILLFLKYKTTSWKKVGFFFLVFFFLSFPTLIYSLTTSGMTRFSQTSAFNDYHGKNIWEAVMFYPLIYLKNYFSYFSLSFIFAAGDGFGRHAMPWFGLLPKWQLPFIGVGLFSLLKSKKSLLKHGALGLLLIAPIAGALALPSPHAIRSLLMVIPLSLLLAVGLITWFALKKKIFRIAFYSILFLGAIETIFFIHHYTIHYPRINQLDWGAGYKEMVAAASQEKNTAFIIDDTLPYASIYFKYYNDSIHPYYGTNALSSIPKNKRIIIIRPYGIASADKLVKNIPLPNDVNNAIFVQFWEVKK